jgi:hypothetical protein
VVEIKAAAKILPIYHAQLLSHLRLSDHRVGLLINFNVARLKDGIVRMVKSRVMAPGHLSAHPLRSLRPLR